MELSKEEQKAIEYLKSRLYGNEGCKFIDVAQEDLRIFLNLLEKLQKENEKQSKVIDEIIQCALLHKPFSTFICKDVSVNDCNKYRENGGCNECIKQYFYRKAEAINKKCKELKWL